MPLPTEQEIERMHRYFAVECNNQAWELAELNSRTPEQSEEMVSLAQTASWHWSKVGKPINEARANMLLGWVHCIIGGKSDALSYTSRVHEQLGAKPDGINAWDEAFAALLKAYTCLIQKDESGFEIAVSKLGSYRAALIEEDKDVFDTFLKRITS